jgi:putative DNA primase/helicase
VDDGPGFTIEDGEDGESNQGKGERRTRRDNRALIFADWDFCRTPDGRALVSVPMPGRGREWHFCPSAGARMAITTAYYALTQSGLSGTTKADLLNLAEARALSSGEDRRPWRRLAWQDGAIYWDLGGGDPKAERRAVKITREGWEVVPADRVEVAFLRAPDALPIPEPERDAAKAEDLRAFVNVEGEDDLALLLAWCICTLRPFDAGGAYPILLLHGEQGSGKSGAAKAIQALIDPSTLTGRALPREERDLFVTAANRHLVAFDNLSGMGDAFADCLCRLATGGGFSARALHTDGDESIFTALRPLLLNGIPSTILSRPDLADRAISLELRPIKQRREEAHLADDFARMRSGFLGLLCDGLSAALRNLADTKIEDPPRMIDACTWAEAAASGLGIEPGIITRAWRANRGASERAALEVDDVAQALLAMLEDHSGAWKGSPSELLRLVCEKVSDRVIRSPYWPKNAAGLGAKLTRIAPGMRNVHRVEVQNGKGGADGTRWWSVRKV